ncbi:hypothetical protein SLS56_008097 [Neofusicoccum ribis]|uniref:Uncharacterized protein n=1 Tax=Neofusicoccum ribis TaxID=45134 RepID=A0ABR3SLI2_9PEZI
MLTRLSMGKQVTWIIRPDGAGPLAILPTELLRVFNSIAVASARLVTYLSPSILNTNGVFYRLFQKMGVGRWLIGKFWDVVTHLSDSHAGYSKGDHISLHKPDVNCKRSSGSYSSSSNECWATLDAAADLTVGQKLPFIAAPPALRNPHTNARQLMLLYLYIVSTKHFQQQLRLQEKNDRNQVITCRARMLSTATSRPDDRIASEDNAAAVTTFAASLDALSPTAVLRAPQGKRKELAHGARQTLRHAFLSFFARGTKDEFLRFEPSSFAPSLAAITRHTAQASNGADAVSTASDAAAQATRSRHRSEAVVFPRERRTATRGAGASAASSTVTAASRDSSAAAHADSGSRSPGGVARSATRPPADKKRKRNREVPDAKLVEQAVGSLSQQLPAEPPLESIQRTSMWDPGRLLYRAAAGAVGTQARGISAVSVIGSMVREHGGDEDEFVRAGRLLDVLILHFYESLERSIRGRSAKDRGGRASTKAYAELSEMMDEKAEELKRKNCETKKLMILAIELGLGRIIEISQKGSNV